MMANLEGLQRNDYQPLEASKQLVLHHPSELHLFWLHPLSEHLNPPHKNLTSPDSSISDLIDIKETLNSYQKKLWIWRAYNCVPKWFWLLFKRTQLVRDHYKVSITSNNKVPFLDSDFESAASDNLAASARRSARQANCSSWERGPRCFPVASKLFRCASLCVSRTAFACKPTQEVPEVKRAEGKDRFGHICQHKLSSATFYITDSHMPECHLLATTHNPWM